MRKSVAAIAPLVEPEWDRQPNEPTDWFRRFCSYRNQMGRRSLRAAYRNELENAPKSGKKRHGKSGTVPGAWDNIFIQWQWQQRVEAWDLKQQQDEDQAWDERMKQLRLNRWLQYEAIRVKAETMLKMPLVKQTTTRNEDNGLVITNIEATEWKQFLNAAKLLAIGDRLGELAVGNLNIAATLLQRAGFKVEPPSSADANALGFESDYADLDGTG